MKLSRNDPCHCGSGKKYKKCCINLPQANSKDSLENQLEQSEEHR